jgi:hypothetical protein
MVEPFPRHGQAPVSNREASLDDYFRLAPRTDPIRHGLDHEGPRPVGGEPSAPFQEVILPVVLLRYPDEPLQTGDFHAAGIHLQAEGGMIGDRFRRGDDGGYLSGTDYDQGQSFGLIGCFHGKNILNSKKSKQIQ